LIPFSGPVPKYHELPGSYHKPAPPEFTDDDEEGELELLELKLLEDELLELLDDDDDCHISIAVKLFQQTSHPGPAPSANICI
jgi:hypothetical protein